MGDNNLESKTDEEIIAIYASEYPSPINSVDLKKLLKNSPELYKEMEKRRLFMNLKYVVSPEIREEYKKIQREDKQREMEGRDSIIRKYDLSLDKFNKIMTERTTGVKLKTKKELKQEKIIKIILEMGERLFDKIAERKEYETLYSLQLIPFKRRIEEGKIDWEEIRKTAESLKNLENKEGYEVIEKLKGYMKKIYNEVKDIQFSKNY